MNLFTESEAIFSKCRSYRYTLTRRWDDGPLANWIMLNPSTADEARNDPTIERCQIRSESMGYAGLVVTNLFAWRDTDPKAMKQVSYPIGLANDHHIREQAERSGIVVCAWGRDGNHLSRQAEVLALLKGIRLHYLLLNRDGTPQHPLYISYDKKPKLWVAA